MTWSSHVTLKVYQHSKEDSVCVCLYEAAGVWPHTHTQMCFFNLLLLPCPSTTSELKWWPSPLVHTCTPFLCWHRWWWAGPLWVALQCYLPSLIPLIQGLIAEIPFPSWNILWKLSMLAVFPSTASTADSLASWNTTCWGNIHDHTGIDLVVQSKGDFHVKSK